MEALVEDNEQEQSTSKFDNPLFQVILFGGFSIFGIYMIMTDSLSHKQEWVEWLMYFGYFVFFPTMFVISLLSYFKGWNDEESDSIVMKTFGWMFGAPIIITIIGIILFFIGNYFASIPSWAAIIIVLLTVLVFRKR